MPISGRHYSDCAHRPTTHCVKGQCINYHIVLADSVAAHVYAAATPQVYITVQCDSLYGPLLLLASAAFISLQNFLPYLLGSSLRGYFQEDMEGNFVKPRRLMDCNNIAGAGCIHGGFY